MWERCPAPALKAGQAGETGWSQLNVLFGSLGPACMAAWRNRVLILTAWQVHILAGRQALEVAGTDKLNAVIADMRPQLRAGDVEAAVEQAVVDIGLVLAGAEVKPGHESGSWLPLGIVVAVIGSFLGFHIW